MKNPYSFLNSFIDKEIVYFTALSLTLALLFHGLHAPHVWYLYAGRSCTNPSLPQHLTVWYEGMQKTGEALSLSQLHEEVTRVNVQYREIYERSSLFLPKDSVPRYKENSVLVGRPPCQFGSSKKRQDRLFNVFTLNT